MPVTGKQPLCCRLRRFARPSDVGILRKHTMAKGKRSAIVKRAGVHPDVAILLGKIMTGKQEFSFRIGEKIFSQGDPADSIYFVQTGRIKITVLSAAGKEAVLAMPGPHEFFGEGALVKQTLRVSTASTLEPSTVF